MLAAAALLCLLALMPAAARAATGSISGTVTDALTDEPVAGIEVCPYALLFVEEGEEFWEECVLTGSDGSYTLPELPAGEYEVSFWPWPLPYGSEFVGPVTVGIGDTGGVDVALTRRAAIQGTVTATADGLPVEEVEVCAYDEATGELAECAWTGADGTYSIPLYEGEFKVEFWPGSSGRTLAVQFYDHSDRWTDADVVSLAEEEWVSGIDADMAPGATISGNVSSLATGQPLEEIRVCSIDAPTGQLWICTWTNAAGNYAMRSHSQGEYKVVFSPELREFFPEAESESDGFPTRFWNNQTTLAAANPIFLSTGGVAGGINAGLGTPHPPAVVTPVLTPPAFTPPVRKGKRKKCRRGYKKKVVRGKRRCVKKTRRHRRHRHDKQQRLQLGAERPLLMAPRQLGR